MHDLLSLKHQQREQLLSASHSAMLNEAYQTLKDPNKRAQYLLSLEGKELRWAS